MGNIRRFLSRYARSNVPQYVAGLVMLFVTNWVVVRIPAILGEALNVLEAGGPTALQQSRGMAIELLVLGVVVTVVRTLSRVLFFNPGRVIEHELRVDLFAHLLSLQRPYFNRHRVGELVSLASNDTTSVRLLVGFAGLQLCNVVVAVPLHLYQMLATDVVLTVWCLAPVVVGGIYMRWTVRRFFGMVRDAMRLLADLSDRVLECYSGIGTIRAHAAQEHTRGRFERLNQEYVDLQLRVAGIRAFGMPVLGFSGLVGAGIVLWVGGDRVLAGKMEVGAMATFTALLMSMVAILTGLAWVLAAISRGMVALDRVTTVLDTEDGLPPVERDVEITGPPRIEFKNLEFGYPGGDTRVLEGVSATIDPGRTLGVFGKTGAGKTTLLELLSRVYTPPRGQVFVDGVDVTRMSLSRLRACMAVVPQSAFLFSSTLRDNIVLGDRDDDEPDPRLEHVIAAASLGDDVEVLPEKLETVVGERGVMLSGGQRQRAALARALYRARPLLLLDDVLSAVDQSTEARMVEAIRGLRGSATDDLAPTTIIVSHRTSVLEHADEIIVLEEGRIVDRGTHAQLVARGGDYARTHEHQAKEADHDR